MPQNNRVSGVAVVMIAPDPRDHVSGADRSPTPSSPRPCRAKAGHRPLAQVPARATTRETSGPASTTPAPASTSTSSGSKGSPRTHRPDSSGYCNGRN